MPNAREKGKRGEREWSKTLNSLLPGSNARRGRQYKGTAESPDVISDLPIHWEVKRRQSFNVHRAVSACRDECSVNRWPAVAHRKDNERWLVSMDAEDFARILKIAFLHI